AATQNSRITLPLRRSFGVLRSELEHVRLCLKLRWRRILGALPSPLWGGAGGGGPSAIAARPPPRRFAPTLPTRGRVRTELAADPDSPQRESTHAAPLRRASASSILSRRVSASLRFSRSPSTTSSGARATKSALASLASMRAISDLTRAISFSRRAF